MKRDRKAEKREGETWVQREDEVMWRRRVRQHKEEKSYRQLNKKN